MKKTNISKQKGLESTQSFLILCSLFFMGFGLINLYTSLFSISFRFGIDVLKSFTEFQYFVISLLTTITGILFLIVYYLTEISKNTNE